MHDLLRIHFDAAREAGIPHEKVVDGFANRAGGLVLESSLMEKYFAAADLAGFGASFQQSRRRCGSEAVAWDWTFRAPAGERSGSTTPLRVPSACLSPTTNGW